MMEVQKYLKQHGIEKLKEEFHIEVHEYSEKGICVLNYSMIDSPRFNLIADSCRGLILKMDTWDIVAYPFDRFFNWQESVQQSSNVSINAQRISSYKEYETKDFDLSKAIIEMKLDGSIMPMRFENNQWEVSSRSMGYAEGQTNFGITFKQAFMDAAKKTELFNFLEQTPDMRDFTIIFELIGPYNRVVTRYSENEIVLIGGRSNKEEFNYRELSATELDNIASIAKIKRPKYFHANTYEELMKLIDSFPVLDEGVVLKIENSDGSHWRVKVKSVKYLAIAHLRGNGIISPKNILNLAMTGDEEEYLLHFETDKPYFDFVTEEFNKVVDRIDAIYEENKNIESQKDFALKIMPQTFYSFESGIIFGMRKAVKSGEHCNINQFLNKLGADKIARGMNLKQKFVDKFHVVVGEEDET